MVSSITLGNIVQRDGKTTLSGSQSGLDTDALITALTTARRQPAADLETKNKTIDSQLTAYTELRSILSKFRSAVDVLRNPPGVQNASKNIFEYRTAALASNTTVAAANYLSVTAEPGTAIQNFTINQIGQLAREAKQNTGNFSLVSTTDGAVVTASGDFQAGLFAAGTITLSGIDGADNQDITLEEGDTLQDVVNKFNAVKNQTGVAATIVKVADGDPNDTFKINFTGTKTGLDYGFNLSDVPGGVGSKVVADDDGVLSSLTFTTTQTAQNAQLTVDGVAVERATNSIDDVIDGITFSLNQTTPGGTTLTLGIEADTSIVQNAVVSFVDAYNSFKLFAARQQEREADGTPTADAVLATDSTLRNIISTVGSEVNNIVAGITGGNPDTLADIGITFEDFAGDSDNPKTGNIMVVDTDALSSALEADFSGVRGVFEFQLKSDNANLSVFSRTNALSISNFTLNIDRNAAQYQATYDDPVTGDPVTVNLDLTELSSGVTLTGPEGSLLEGLQLIFLSSVTTVAEINVTISQGIGDRLFNALETMLDNTDGTVTNAIDAYQSQKNFNEEEITKIDDKVETYRQQLVDRYAQLEAALTKANQLLQLLTAQDNARVANS